MADWKKNRQKFQMPHDRVERCMRYVKTVEKAKRKAEKAKRAAARPEPAQGTAKNRLILRCVGAHCAPLRDNVYQSLDTVRRVVAPYVLAIDRQFSQ